MPSASPRPVLTSLRTFGLAGMGAITAALMALNALSDPYDPSLEGTARYGHNAEGALYLGIAFTLAELGVLHAVLRPWQREGRAWLRILAMLVLLVPWTLFSALMAMHAGGIAAIHLLWLLAVGVVLVAALVVSPWVRREAPSGDGG